MNDVFNLPQGITSVTSNGFAGNIFANCSGAAFTMNDVFNLPQGITTVGQSFAANMFQGCSGAAFTMNAVFNLPQGITSVGQAFANNLFMGAGGPSFQVNSVFRFPILSQTQLNQGSVFITTFSGLAADTPVQQRSALSIINSQLVPVGGGARNTFGVSSNPSPFADWGYVPTSYGGGGGAAFTRYAVTFDSVGGSAVAFQTVEIDALATEPAAPTKDGYEFTGWYAETSAGLAADPYDFDTPVAKNVYLHAAWTESGDPEPGVGEPGSGDFDGDGYVTMADVVVALQAVVSGTDNLTPEQIAALDIDGDGFLTMADVIKIMRLAAGV
jgi:uncharacterized repeat protein (TIGR02543 family)